VKKEEKNELIKEIITAIDARQKQVWTALEAVDILNERPSCLLCQKYESHSGWNYNCDECAATKITGKSEDGYTSKLCAKYADKVSTARGLLEHVDDFLTKQKAELTLKLH